MSAIKYLSAIAILLSAFSVRADSWAKDDPNLAMHYDGSVVDTRVDLAGAGKDQKDNPENCPCYRTGGNMTTKQSGQVFGTDSGTGGTAVKGTE